MTALVIAYLIVGVVNLAACILELVDERSFYDRSTAFLAALLGLVPLWPLYYIEWYWSARK